MNTNLHLLGVAHTVPHEDYLVCAFTAKVLLFPEVIQPFGWYVIEYSNEGSVSEAREHAVILTKDRLRALSRRQSREEPLDADVNNPELQEEFQRVLVEKIRSRAHPGDIVCHVWGPNMEVYNLLPDCHHVELCVGYTASPGLPFRIYETSAWMHWHYGKAGQEDGNHYKWVIPSPLDADRWLFCERPDDYAIFLGRVTARKGLNELVEIARRMPELPIHVYGPGDVSEWATTAPPNLIFKGPIFGNERIDVVRRARCMLMPTVFIEPFGNSGVEAQLCGVPLIGASYGAFQETLLEGVTGYRCHTLADWVEAIRLSKTLDRRQIAAFARSRYSKDVVGKQYDWVLRQLGDLSGRGWYSEKSRKFSAGAAVPLQASELQERRIWLYMPYFGALPNYFQLYLDSLGRNTDCLSVFLVTDNDLSNYRIPENLILIPMTFDMLKERIAYFISDEFGITVQPDAILKEPYKLCDFRILYPALFSDFSERYGVTESDFVGWGDCDVIYGRFSHFLNMDEDTGVIGGFHGHLTALRNTDSFRKLFRAVANLPVLLLDEKSHIVDEIAFRQPLLDFLEQNRYKMFYTNQYFCDITPECFWGLFRQNYQQRNKIFFDGYHAEKNIDHLYHAEDGRLTVFYDDKEYREIIYCHLQKRAMSLNFDRSENGYYICENAFSLTVPPRGDALGSALASVPSEVLRDRLPLIEAPSASIKLILVCGPMGSGTTAVAGTLEHLGAFGLAPYLATPDPRTANSYESLAFREIVFRYADEATISAVPSAPGAVQSDLRELRQRILQHEFGFYEAEGTRPIFLKCPISALLIAEICEVFDTKLIYVNRALEDIEKTRLRRDWLPFTGAAGAEGIYRAMSEAHQDRSMMTVEYATLLSSTQSCIQEIARFAGLEPEPGRLQAAINFIIHRAQ